jgi:hypothetical protein
VRAINILQCTDFVAIRLSYWNNTTNIVSATLLCKNSAAFSGPIGRLIMPRESSRTSRSGRRAFCTGLRSRTFRALLVRREQPRMPGTGLALRLRGLNPMLVIAASFYRQVKWCEERANCERQGCCRLPKLLVWRALLVNSYCCRGGVL